MEYLKFIPAFFAGLLTFFYGEWSALLTILVALVIIDFVTGLTAASLDGGLKSKKGMIGIARKVFIFAMVAVAHLIDLLLIESGFESTELVMTMVIVFYAVNEILSITENAGRIDLPVPDQIKNAIEILRGSDKKCEIMVTIKDIRPITPRTNGTRALSAIKNIARHHSATADGNWAAFWRYWNGTLKWGTGGYHEIILRDGTVELCYDPEEITNGVGGQNSYIYNICLVGNGSFTAEQERVFDERARYWMKRLGLSAKDVKGHNEFPKQSTNCPGTDMNKVRARLIGVVADASTKKDNVELIFSSPSLKAETEISLLSKARSEIIVKVAVEAGAHSSWLDKLENKTITDTDVLGLAVKYTVVVNK